MPNDDLKRLWDDPAHWTSIGFYRCADDPRWWVLKRPPGIGWTINVAQRGAIWSLVALIVASMVPVVMIMAFGRRSPSASLLVGLLVPTVLVIALFIWFSVRDAR